jgi:hypothetical protein
MGLNVSVYKFPLGDCTLKGISGGDTRDLCLVNVDGPTSPREGVPAAMLVKGNMPGMVKIVPALLDDKQRYSPDPRWCMMGGNYAATSDSRFHEAVRKITGGESYGAVPIHDRIE